MGQNKPEQWFGSANGSCYFEPLQLLIDIILVVEQFYITKDDM